jgi:hypothetical protein
MVDISLEIRRADGTRYTAGPALGRGEPDPGHRAQGPGDRSRVAIDTSGLF